MIADFSTALSHYQGGDAKSSEQVCRALVAAQPKHVDALHLLGQIALDGKQFNQAERSLRKALKVAPGKVEPTYTLAECFAAQGKRDKAIQLLEQCLTTMPDFFHAHSLLARLQLQGPDYHDMLAELHATIKPKRYLEIGVSRGNSFRLASPDTLAIGIDPEPRVDFALPHNHRIAELTSDDFFADGHARDWFAGETFDFAFIDGMHRFEFALRDFMNLERYSNAGSWVAVHDCIPLNEATAQAERSTTFWSGDVWKLIIALKKYRPDLDVLTLPCPPTGLGVIRNLDADNRIISDNYDAIVEEIRTIGFEHIRDNKAQQLNQTGIGKARKTWAA